MLGIMDGLKRFFARERIPDGVPPDIASPIRFKGHFEIECVGKDGRTKWKTTAENDVTNEGLNSVLDVMFHGSSQITTWYIGLIRDDNYSALANADTMSSHAGWEEADEYSESTRQEWTEGAASSQSITNAATVDFSINATETMKGIFLTSSATKSGTSGTLWATALFSSGDQAVANGDTLKVTYTVTASRSS